MAISEPGPALLRWIVHGRGTLALPPRARLCGPGQAYRGVARHRSSIQNPPTSTEGHSCHGQMAQRAGRPGALGSADGHASYGHLGSLASIRVFLVTSILQNVAIVRPILVDELRRGTHVAV